MYVHRLVPSRLSFRPRATVILSAATMACSEADAVSENGSDLCKVGKLREGMKSKRLSALNSRFLMLASEYDSLIAKELPDLGQAYESLDEAYPEPPRNEMLASVDSSW